MADAYPAALRAVDSEGNTPLSYLLAPPVRLEAAPEEAAAAQEPDATASWAWDSGLGYQDYDDATTTRLEQAFATRQPRCDVGGSRYVDLPDTGTAQPSKSESLVCFLSTVRGEYFPIESGLHTFTVSCSGNLTPF